MFDKVHAARLTALADHLERAVALKVDKFYFACSLSDVETYTGGGHREGWPKCGTVGCACGEASLLWPEHFRSGTDWLAMAEDAQKFFGLSFGEREHLFDPNQQDLGLFGGQHLGNNATRYEVAANIRAFLEIKAREQAAP